MRSISLPRVERWRAAWLVLVALLVAFPARSYAQGQPSVTAQLSTGIVKLGQNVALLIQVDNARDATVEPFPEVDGLRIGPLGPMSTSQQSVISGGRWATTYSLSWRVPVVATKKGEFRIPPVTVDVKGTKLVTRELVLKVVEDLQGEELGFFEIDAPDEVAEGQPFSLELRFGWDVQLEQRINFANLSLPWVGELPGVIELDAPPSAPNASFVELNLNSRDRIRAERLAAPVQGQDRAFNVLRVKKRYLATRAGRIEIPTSHLEFGQIDQNNGFFNIRPTREKETYYKRFPGFAIDVVKLPDQGRPIDFGGAVGRVLANATPDRRDVDVGDSIKLTVEWTGEANLEFFDGPDPSRSEAFKDFRLYGTNDKKSYERRTVVYDLAPITPDVKEIPPIPLVVYDPAKKAYVKVETQPVPIHVRPLKNAVSLGVEDGKPGTVPDIRDIDPRPVAGARAETRRGWLPWSALGVVVFGWVALRTWVRKQGDPDAPRARARRTARKTLGRELEGAAKASDQARALERFLAARTGERPTAWLGRDVVAWVEETGARLGADDARARGRLRAARRAHVGRHGRAARARRARRGRRPRDSRRSLMSAWILRLVLAASCVLALAASGRASAVQSVRDGGRDSEGLIDDHAARSARVDPVAANQLAVDAYRAGDLETARTHWTALLPGSEGAEKARVLYDLGNVAFRAKKPLEAVGWYTAALELAPRDEDLWANLEHARREAGLEPADRGDLVATLRRAMTSFTRGESELLAAGAALLWAALLVLEALRGGRLGRRLAFVGGAFVLLAFAPFLTHLATEARDPMLVVAPKERPLALKSEPRADAAVVAQAPSGAVVERYDALPGWTAVELVDGTRGWAAASDVFALRR
ncbi:MAG: BatD family protein [Planctomycetes bacterium]|nr:BatD family protein [Planctomycetota bacterium]